LPIASLVLLVAGLLAAGAPGRPNVHRALLAAQHLSVIGFGLLVLTIVALSIFLQPVISAVVAMLEDRVRWPLIGRVADILRLRAWMKLEKGDEKPLRQYPSSSRVRATTAWPPLKRTPVVLTGSTVESRFRGWSCCCRRQPQKSSVRDETTSCSLHVSVRPLFWRCSPPLFFSRMTAAGLSCQRCPQFLRGCLIEMPSLLLSLMARCCG
jgi:hypothetical protein